MERRQLLKGLAGLAACPICAAAGTAHAETGHHWNYRNVNEWGGVCSTGSRQSPVDIVSIKRDPQARDLALTFGQRAAKIKNNGHTIEVECGGTMRFGNVQYRLQQFHFHHPSEHRLNGAQFAMEVHFVHQGPSGLGVVGVFMKPGARNQTFAKIVAAMPRQKGEVDAPAGIFPLGLVPSSTAYAAYAGSLTTPTGKAPAGDTCTENVTWIVIRQPIEVASANITAFAGVYRMNARPVKRRMANVPGM